MTSLVAAASASHGLTALQVKVAAQALYERYKVISYPRSDCRYLPLGQHEDALGVLHAIARNDPEKSILCGNADPAILSEAWDTARLSAHSHHAIIPVANTVNFANASHEERVVYDLICRSYIAQFYPHAEHLQTKVEALVLGHRFSLSQRETVTPGWRTLYPPKVAREKQRIPSLIEGDELRCTATQIDERTTKPKERFTDGTLMLAMEDAGRHVGDDTDEGRVSIGTEATRTDTIEGLFDHRFIMRKGRYIESTELGRDLIRDVQDEIKGVRMTAAFERVLDKIAEGKASPEAFLDRMRSLIIELLANVSIKDRKLARASTENGGDAFRKLAVTKPERKAKAKKRKRFAA
jgi:DNA topoisomerase-3